MWFPEFHRETASGEHGPRECVHRGRPQRQYASSHPPPPTRRGRKEQETAYAKDMSHAESEGQAPPRIIRRGMEDGHPEGRRLALPFLPACVMLSSEVWRGHKPPIAGQGDVDGCVFCFRVVWFRGPNTKLYLDGCWFAQMQPLPRLSSLNVAVRRHWP